MIMAIVMIFLAGLFGNLRSKAGETAHFNTGEISLSVSNAANPTLAVLR